MTEEKTIFQGSPSQILNAYVFAGCGLVGVLVVVLGLLFNWWAFLLLLPIPIGIAAWKWLELKSRLFEVTTERIRMSRGIFTRRTDELELYRVNDISVVEPFILRTLGLGHVVITTDDTSTPVLTISAIRKVHELREDLRKCVEACRERKRVRVTEME
jgi:uncharacterized membrane protein YdbT with pleckstrin-like domain